VRIHRELKYQNRRDDSWRTPKRHSGDWNDKIYGLFEKERIDLGCEVRLAYRLGYEKCLDQELGKIIRYLRTHDKMGKTVEQLEDEVMDHLYKQ